MSLHFVGDYAFRQCSMPAWKAKQTFDPDECSLSYNGGVTLKEAFLDACAAGQSLAFQDYLGTGFTRPKMWVVGASDDGHPRQPKVTLQLKGFRDSGTPPKTETENTLFATSVSTTNGAETLTYQYFAARTSYKYWRIEEPDPDVPEFTTVLDTTDPLDPKRLIRRSISGGGAMPALADFIALFNLLIRDVQVSDYKVKPVIPDKLWQCGVCVDYVLIPP